MAPRPDRHRGEPTLRLQLAHGQVLEDAVLHSPRPSWSSSRMRDGLPHVEPVLGLLTPGHLEDRVQPGTDPAVFGVLLAHPLELVELAVHRLAHRLGQVALGRLVR